MRYTYCLICESTTNLTCHHIIPTSITKYLEYTYKTEDIVCLCSTCHKQYHQSLHSKLPKLMSIVGINISEVYAQVRKYDIEKLRRQLTALKKDIPSNVRKTYIENIEKHFTGFDVTNLDYYIEICVANRVKFSIEKYISDNVNIESLEFLYRNHFNSFVNKRIK